MPPRKLLVQDLKPFVNYLFRFDDEEINRKRFLTAVYKVLAYLETDARKEIANLMAVHSLGVCEEFSDASSRLDEQIEDVINGLTEAGKIDPSVTAEIASTLRAAHNILEKMFDEAEKPNELSKFAAALDRWMCQPDSSVDLDEDSSADALFPPVLRKLTQEPRAEMKKLLLQRPDQLASLPQIEKFATEE